MLSRPSAALSVFLDMPAAKACFGLATWFDAGETCFRGPHVQEDKGSRGLPRKHGTQLLPAVSVYCFSQSRFLRTYALFVPLRGMTCRCI
jgi:hypothetical protein